MLSSLQVYSDQNYSVTILCLYVTCDSGSLFSGSRLILILVDLSHLTNILATVISFCGFTAVGKSFSFEIFWLIKQHIQQSYFLLNGTVLNL
jgi:hypothetical protein